MCEACDEAEIDFYPHDEYGDVDFDLDQPAAEHIAIADALDQIMNKLINKENPLSANEPLVATMKAAKVKAKKEEEKKGYMKHAKLVATPKEIIIFDSKDALVKQAPTTAVAKVFFLHNAQAMSILPPAVRWVSSDGRWMIFERPPFTTISRDENGDEYEVTVPWTVWSIGVSFNYDTGGYKFIDVEVYSTPWPITTPNSALSRVPVPELYDPNLVLVSAAYLDGTKYNATLESAVTKLFEMPFLKRAKRQAKLSIDPEHIFEDFREGCVVDGKVVTSKLLRSLRDLPESDLAFMNFPAVTTVGELIEKMEAKEQANNIFSKYDRTIDVFSALIDLALGKTPKE